MTGGTIIASSLLCPVGRGCDQAWASIRAGLSRLASSNVLARNLEPIRMGLVPEDALVPLLPELDSLPLPFRARRMLQLAAPVLRNVAERAGGGAVRLYLGLPKFAPDEAAWLRAFAVYLAKQASVELDGPNSRVFPAGRAAVLVALEAALETLASQSAHCIIVGGVDTFLDPRVLVQLDADQRILGEDTLDGFIPGEGAGFIALAGPGAVDGNSGAVAVQAAASAADPGHRKGTEPARGEGLARALTTLRSRLAETVPVGTVFAGLNGESFDAKLWGVANIRHSDFFRSDVTVEHPADCYGDAGAATGAILTALAATAVARGQRSGPALVWAASDHEPRACALVTGNGASAGG